MPLEGWADTTRRMPSHHGACACFHRYSTITMIRDYSKSNLYFLLKITGNIFLLSLFYSSCFFKWLAFLCSSWLIMFNEGEISQKYSPRRTSTCIVFNTMTKKTISLPQQRYWALITLVSPLHSSYNRKKISRKLAPISPSVCRDA